MRAHPYSAGEARRPTVWVVLIGVAAVLAGLVVWVIIPALGSLAAFVGDLIPALQTRALSNAFDLLLPVIRGSPFILCVLLVYWIFDTRAWKMKMFNSIPDLNGTWDGELISDARPQEKFPIKLRIRQTWSKIMITVESDKTFSYSINGSVSFESDELVELLNVYMAEPKLDPGPAVITRHYGTNIVHFRMNEQKKIVGITGLYYTERDQGHHGSFAFNINVN